MGALPHSLHFVWQEDIATCNRASPLVHTKPRRLRTNERTNERGGTNEGGLVALLLLLLHLQRILRTYPRLLPACPLLLLNHAVSTPYPSPRRARPTLDRAVGETDCAAHGKVIPRHPERAWSRSRAGFASPSTAPARFSD